MVRITLEGFGSKDNLWSYGVEFSLHFPSLMPRMFKEGWDEKVPSNHFFLALSFSSEGLGEGVEQRSGLPSTGQGGGHRWGGHRKLVLALGSGLLRVSRLRGRSRCVWGGPDWEGTKDTHW